MSEQGISYAWSVEGAFPGLDDGLKKVDAATKATDGLKQSTKHVDDEMKTLQATLAKLKRPQEISKMKEEIANFGKELPHVSEGFKGVGHHIEETRSKLAGFLEFTGAMVAIELVEKLTETVFELGKEIIKAGAEEERTGKVFTINYGEVGGEQALKYAEKFAAASEFTEDQSKGFLAALLSSGVPLKEMDAYMAAAGDTASRFGNKLEGMNMAVEALGRANLSGKLDGRTLRALKIGVPQLSELEEFAHKSEAQLKKILSEGTLTKGQVLRVIAGKDGVLGDKGVEMSETMSAKLDKLASVPGRLFQEFGKTEAFEVLKGQIDQVLEKFDPSSPGGKQIIKGIGDIGLALTGSLKNVNVDDLVKGVKTVLDVVTKVAEVFGFVARHVGDIGRATKSMASPVTGAYDLAKGVVKGLFGSAEDSGKAIGDGLSSGLAAGVPKVADSAATMAETPGDITKKVNKIESPSKVFRGFGQNIVDGFALGIGAGAGGGIADVMAGAFSVPAPQLGGRAAGGMAGMGGISLSFGDINVDGHGAQDGRELGRAVTEAVQELLPSALVDVFERANAMAGAAA